MLVNQPTTHALLQESFQAAVGFPQRAIAEVVHPAVHDAIDVANEILLVLPRHVVAHHTPERRPKTADAFDGWAGRQVSLSTTEAVLNTETVSQEIKRFLPGMADPCLGLVECQTNPRQDLIRLGKGFLRMLTAQNHESSSPGESHPQALTEPDVNLSIYPAPLIQSISTIDITLVKGSSHFWLT